MKLTTEQKPLANVLKRVIGIVEQRNTIPILGNVLINVADGSAEFRATDLDIEATATISVDVQAPGSCTVGAKMLAGIVSKLPTGALIEMELDGHKLNITAGRSKFSLDTLDARDFPEIANAEYDATFDLDAAELHKLFSAVAMASTEETRYYLQGVYLHNVDGKTLAVATDGHKLAKMTVDADNAFPGVIIPRKTVVEAVKAFASGLVQISVSETKIRMASPEYTLISKVIDGTFPDYTRVIPSGYVNTVTFNSSDMKTVIDRVTTVAETRDRAVKLIIGSGGIAVSTVTAQSSANDVLDADVNGPDLTIGFNGGFMLDLMAQIEGQVTMCYGNSGGDPAIMTTGDDAVYLLMPMRVA